MAETTSLFEKLYTIIDKTGSIPAKVLNYINENFKILEMTLQGNIGSDNLSDGSITNAKLSEDSVGINEIMEGAVTELKIAADAVTEAKISANAVTQNKIAANAVVAEKIAAGAVTAEKMTVSELSAISANMGHITAGTIEADVVIASEYATTDAVTLSRIPGLAYVNNSEQLGSQIAGFSRFSQAFNSACDYNLDYHIPRYSRTLLKADLTTATLTHSGMTAFNSGLCVNGNHYDSAWHTDSAVMGAYIQIDLGVGNAREFVKCKVYSTGVNAGIYDVQYSDNEAIFTTIAQGVGPFILGHKEKMWSPAGKHRYWRITLSNTPGSGAWMGELEFFVKGNVYGDNNLLINPDFEEGNFGWTIANTAIENIVGYRGNWRGRITCNGTGGERDIYQEIYAKPNTTYAISVWAKKLGGSGTLRIEAYWIGIREDYTIVTTTSEWAKYTFEATSPANVNILRIYLYGIYTDVTDVVVDCVKLEEKVGLSATPMLPFNNGMFIEGSNINLLDYPLSITNNIAYNASAMSFGMDSDGIGDMISCTDQANGYYVKQNITADGGPLTHTVWARKGTATNIRICLYDSTAGSYIAESFPVLSNVYTPYSISVNSTVGGHNIQVYLWFFNGTTCISGEQVCRSRYYRTLTVGTRSIESISIPSKNIIFPSEGTINFWTDISSIIESGDTYPFPFSVKHPTVETEAFSLYYQKDNGTWNLQTRDDASSGVAWTSFTHNLSGWHMITATWKDKMYNIYIDGVLECSLNVGVYWCTSFRELQLGRRISSYYANTCFAELQCSNIARSANDILMLYNSCKPAPVDEFTTLKMNFDGTLRQTARNRLLHEEGTLIISDASTTKNPSKATHIVPPEWPCAQSTICQAINELPGTGGTISLLDGVFIVNGTIDTGYNVGASIRLGSNMTLKGQGSSTLIRAIENKFNMVMISNKGFNSGVYDKNISISNISFDTSGIPTSTPVVAINFDRTDGLQIVNCFFKNITGSAIDMWICNGCMISNNTIDSNGFNSIHCSGATGGTISNNTMTNGKGGLYIVDSSYFAIIGNAYQGVTSGGGNSGIALYNASCQYNTIQNNNIKNAWASGITLYGACHNIISNNYIVKSDIAGAAGMAGILLDPYSGVCVYNNIQNNTCRTGGSSVPYGIRINSGCTGNIVTNNDLTSSGSSASLSDAGTGTITAAGNRL